VKYKQFTVQNQGLWVWNRHGWCCSFNPPYYSIYKSFAGVMAMFGMLPVRWGC